jgi:hypothetical protein
MRGRGKARVRARPLPQWALLLLAAGHGGACGQGDAGAPGGTGSAPREQPGATTLGATPPSHAGPTPELAPPSPPGTHDPPAPEPDDPGSARPAGFRLNGLRLAAFRADPAGFGSFGLATTALAQDDRFAAWFERADGGDRALHDELMTYLTACALPPGRTIRYTDTQGGAHAWTGDLGLAPGWGSVGPRREAEQQLVTACLMAHANTALPEPRHIQIALRGAAPLVPPPLAVSAVLDTFDGVFFGDLFASPPRLFICSPTAEPPGNYRASLLRDWGRDCFFAKDGCGGVFTQVDCAQTCKPASGDVGYAWGPGCSVDGRTYPAISAYVPRFMGVSRMDAAGAVRAVCDHCFDFKALRLGLTASYARSDWRLPAGGDYVLDVHYANPDADAALRIEVNGAFVRNGDSDGWEFPATGGGDVWSVRSIPVTLQPTNIVVLRGAGTPGPMVDAIWLRMR